MSQKPQLPLHAVTELIQLYEAGATINALAENFGVSTVTIYKYLNTNGVRLRGVKRQKEQTIDVEKLINDYRDFSLSIREVRKRHNINSDSRLYNILYDLEEPTRTERKSMIRQQRMQALADDYMNTEKPIRQLCRDHNITQMTLYNWINELDLPRRNGKKQNAPEVMIRRQLNNEWSTE